MINTSGFKLFTALPALTKKKAADIVSTAFTNDLLLKKLNVAQLINSVKAK
jgi:hypothetical protein